MAGPGAPVGSGQDFSDRPQRLSARNARVDPVLIALDRVGCDERNDGDHLGSFRAAALHFMMRRAGRHRQGIIYVIGDLVPYEITNAKYMNVEPASI
jgi:hypothetical protein